MPSEMSISDPISPLTGIATIATLDNERNQTNYGVEDGGKRSRNILAVTPRI
jgi:hypothetical protein